MTPAEKKLSSSIASHLHWAYESMLTAGRVDSFNPLAANHYFKDGMRAIEAVELHLADYRTAIAPAPMKATIVTRNPHHSGYMADDERRADFCPHCGNEDGYDSERRCPVCHLWDLDDEHAKRFRLAELVKEMTGEELDKVFSLTVMKVVL